MIPWKGEDDQQEELRLAEVAADLGAILYAITASPNVGGKKKAQDPTGGTQSKAPRDLIEGDE